MCYPHDVDNLTALQIHNHTGQILKNTQEILTLMTSQNALIAKLAADFAAMQSDLGALFTGVSTLTAAVTAFVSSVAAGTVLSSDDAATLALLDTAAQALDAAGKAAAASVAAVVVPAPVAPPAQ